MDKTEKIEEFYKRKFDWIPENLHHNIGHFNLFKVKPLVLGEKKPAPYKRRDFFKITTIKGENKIHYADKVIEIEKQAMVFSNPFIPYRWEHIESEQEGYFCIFNQDFFHNFGDLSHYEVYQPGGIHVFDLTDEQLKQVFQVYERMENELSSDYVHKYDLIRNLVYELLHFAMKMQPNTNFVKQETNANKRISMLFLELLERQFPIDDSHTQMQMRTASEFADQLAVHVNHLNRAVKSTTGKTTTQVIAERVLQEAKILLRQSAWSVSEIAYALGFKEVTHFNNFFKKHTKLSPTQFRNR